MVSLLAIISANLKSWYIAESYLHRGNPEDQKRPASARAMENERDRSHFRTRPSSSASIAQREYNPSSFLRAMSGSRDILPDSDHRGREKIKEPAKSEPLVEHPTLVTELSAEKRLLDEVPLEVQEAWICEDLLFVLQVSLEASNVPFEWLMSPFRAWKGCWYDTMKDTTLLMKNSA